MGSKNAALISFILNIKKDFDYIFVLVLASGITILNDCDQLIIIFFAVSMSILSQITYDNMALIFLSYFHGYNKNEIFCTLLGHMECF
jgi:hypothetical protein